MSVALAIRGESLQYDSGADMGAWRSLFSSWGYRSSSSKETVTQGTVSSLSAAYACQNIVSVDTAKIPIKVMRRKGRDSEVESSHRVHLLLTEAPNPETSPLVFRQTLVADRMGWGVGYAEIQRDRNDDPGALWNVHPSRAERKHDDNGTLWFEVRCDDGTKRRVEAEDMIEVRAPRGVSVIQLGVESFGIALSEQKYAGSYLGNAISPSGFISTPEKLTPEQRGDLRTNWGETYGGPENAGHVGVLHGGWTFQALAIKPADAQLLESRKFSTEDICRWFRVPPEKVYRYANAPGWQSREFLAIEYVTDSLMPYYVEVEQVLGHKLLTPEERRAGLYIKHFIQGLMRGDAKTRSAFYERGLRQGWLSPNDIAELEDKNGIGPAGDTNFIPLQLAPIADVADGSVRSSSEPAAEPGEPAEGESDETKAQAQLRPVFEDAARRFSAKHSDRAARLLKKHKDDTAGLLAEWTEQMPAMREAFVRSFKPAALAFGHADPDAVLAALAAPFWDHVDAGVKPEELAHAVMASLALHASCRVPEGKTDGEAD